MPTLADLLTVKGSRLHAISSDSSVLNAVRRMNLHKVGALLVTHEDQIAGIFTERDVLRRVVAEAREPQEVKVAEVMTTDVICCPPETYVEDASRIMKDRRVRHLPVCGDDGSLLGMISIGDLNAFYASGQEQVIHGLKDYIYGRV